jgi:hypothetical protein
MIAALLDLPAHLRKRLASALESRLFAPPYSVTSVNARSDARSCAQSCPSSKGYYFDLGRARAEVEAWLVELNL